MESSEAREIVESRMRELEAEMQRADRWLDKRPLLSGISSCMQMLCYLDLLDSGFKPRFKLLDITQSLDFRQEILA